VIVRLLAKSPALFVRFVSDFVANRNDIAASVEA